MQAVTAKRKMRMASTAVLGAAMLALLVSMAARPAQAGWWEITIPPAEFDGTTTVKTVTTEAMGGVVQTVTRPWSQSGTGATAAPGPSAWYSRLEAKSEGGFTIVCTYYPDYIYDEETWEEIEDPNDPGPDAMLHLKIWPAASADMVCTEGGNYFTNWALEADNGNGGTAVLNSEPNYTWHSKHMNRPPILKTIPNSSRQRVLRIKISGLKASGWMTGGFSPNSWGARVSASATISAQLSELWVKEPPPFGRALYDYSLPWETPQTLNQYLITDIIPATLGCRGADTELLEQYRSSAQWTFERMPLALVPSGPNATTSNGNVHEIFAQHLTGYAMEFGMRYDSPSIRGLKFETIYGLPASNSAFGVNAVKVTVSGMTAKSPIALFYPATATTHPPGGPEGWALGPGNIGHTYRIPTPNFIYYYSQAYSAPCTINYWDSDYSAYLDGDDHLHIGRDAHGAAGEDTYLFGKVRNADGTLGGLRQVGTESAMGIDLYARVVVHENVHKRCYEAIHPSDGSQGLIDEDGDKVPDDWEGQVGLTVGTTDSVKVNGVGWGERNYQDASKGDSEVFARMYERGVQGNIDGDWADDGLNYGRPTPCNRANRNPQYPDDGVNLSSVQWPDIP